MAQSFTIDSARGANLNVLDEPRKYGHVVHDVVTAMRAGRRSGSANTKTRSELHKPDKKPWRQKGTGRARSGTVNSPLWRGGAVTFGPKPRDYSKKVNLKVKRLAFRAALSSRIADGQVTLVDSFSVADGKTKSYVAAIEKLGGDKTLVVAAAFDESTYLAARNHGASLLATAREVNVEDVLRYDRIIITQDALPVLAERTAA